jgi:hypothetical protein
MDADGEAALAAYLEHLSDDDVRALAGAVPSSRLGVAAAELRSEPRLLAERLAAPETFAAVLGPPFDGGPLPPVSPFLVFAVAVERGRNDLREAGFVPEWLGPRRRLPVFAPGDLRDFLSDPWRRLFLVRLLSSYTHVSSGAVFVPTRRGLRRQRFSELDPVRLAGLLDVVPDSERAGILRRLGDLSLFLTGVFPDHTALAGFGPVALGRLLRAGRHEGARRPSPTSGATAPAEMGAVDLLEHLGRRWYRLAAAAVPPPRSRDLEVVAELGQRFDQARRVLNLVTDRYLFPLRDQWFGAPGRG